MVVALGLAANWSSSGEKNCIVYSLFCIFFISSSCNSRIISVISISIYFVVLLNCLSLNTQVLPFSISPSILLGLSISTGGRGEPVTLWCLAASCWVKPWQRHGLKSFRFSVRCSGGDGGSKVKVPLL